MNKKDKIAQVTIRTATALSLAIAAATTAPLLHAQQLEEVIVTATKRAQGLQDVPIALSVMTGEKISEQGIGELEDLAVFMPNVHIAEGGTGTQLFIRGIGSGINFGFEQSVGTFIDGVYYGRGRNARGAFLDLERVEVLKGPQSTLFGKNTIAGAINITSAKPTDEFEGFIESTYETELEGIGVTAMISGPLSNTFRGRLVAKVYEDDGYVKNKLGDDGPQEDTSLVRGTLVWDASDNLTLTAKIELGQFDVIGRQDQISIATDTANSLFRTFGGDPSFSPKFDYNESGLSLPGSSEFDDTESEVYVLTADFAMGEFGLRSITAYTHYEFENNADVDYGPLAFLERGRQEEHKQFSQEFLLTSPVGGTIEYLTGVYYQTNELTSDRDTLVRFSGVPPIDGAIGGMFGVGPGGIDSDSFAFFQQDTDTWSAFVSLTWNISDVFRATGGLRYSDEKKDMEKSQFIAKPGETTPDPFQSFVLTALAFAEPHDYAFDRDEQHWTGNINLQYDWGDSAMIYFNVANGFKGGGFDESNALGDLTVAEFEDETVISYELGAKIDLWDRRGRLNLAIFKSDFEDVQVSTFDGNCCFVVGNAAETTVEGFEADFNFAATDALTLNAAIGYLDATYDSFPDAACNVHQIVDGRCAANGGVQDLSGKSLQFAPDWAGSFGAAYVTNLTDDLELRLGMDANYSDDVVVPNDLDPNLFQESFWKVNARAAIGSPDGKWMLAVVGKNLTDEKTTTWGNDVPLGSLGFRFTYFQHIDPPQTIEFQARYSF